MRVRVRLGEHRVTWPRAADPAGGLFAVVRVVHRRRQVRASQGRAVRATTAATLCHTAIDTTPATTSHAAAAAAAAAAALLHVGSSSAGSRAAAALATALPVTAPAHRLPSQRELDAA